MDSNGYKQDLDDISRIISQWDCGCRTVSEAREAIARVLYLSAVGSLRRERKMEVSDES